MVETFCEMTGRVTAHITKFSIKDFFSKHDQIRRKLRIWSHLLKKPLMENFIFCVEWKTSFFVLVVKTLLRLFERIPLGASFWIYVSSILAGDSFSDLSFHKVIESVLCFASLIGRVNSKFEPKVSLSLLEWIGNSVLWFFQKKAYEVVIKQLNRRLTGNIKIYWKFMISLREMVISR